MKKLFSILSLLLLCQIGFAQNLLESVVKLNEKDQSISSILTKIKEVYEIPFSYGNLDLSNLKTIEFEASLSDILTVLLEDEEIVFKEMNKQIVLKSKENSTIDGTNTLKGRVIDSDSQSPLFGAIIKILGTNPLKGSSTDFEGYYSVDGLPFGRYDVEVSYLGYEAQTIPQLLVTSGKENYRTVELTESINSLAEVVVKASKNTGEPINEMATLSARSFSVEETQRYAAAVSDPARMAQSFAGVTGGGDDLSNEIIIRGNSSRGLLWRLEGVEIPSPNHYGDLGSGGGSINMISSSTLANSDFYTGAFPAEYGNALSGVFDLKDRMGH